MKKIFIIAALLSVTTAFAQQNKFDAGLEGGSGLIILRGNAGRVSPGIGLSGGLSFQYNFQKILSLKTGLAFERKGGRVDQRITDANENTMGQAALPNQFDYVVAPLLLRATFGKKVKCFVNAGAFAGYLIRQTVVYRRLYLDGINGLPVEADNTNLYKRFDTGITTGVGLEIPIRNRFAFSFELRDNCGLLNVNKANNPVVKTNSASLLIGFACKLS